MKKRLKWSRYQAYLAILASVILVCLLYQAIWIFSRSTKAKIVFVPDTYGKRKVAWMSAEYRVDFITYRRLFLKEDYDNHEFFVRYLTFAPGLVRSDTFASNWGPPIMFFILCFLVTSIVFIRDDMISEHALFDVGFSRPFISIQNNLLQDYDEHEIQNKKTDQTNAVVLKKMRAEENASIASGIMASVYKYNQTAVIIIIVYIFYFFWAIPHIFFNMLGYPSIFFFGGILIFVPIYIQNTRNPVFKMKIPDEGSLAFSTSGIIYKDFAYELENIESAVIYLESFKGFKHRERITTGNTNTLEDGDNNKISFRYRGEVVDLTFILSNVSDYWALNKLAAIWSAKGINIVLRKVFDDEFVLQEEAYFHS